MGTTGITALTLPWAPDERLVCFDTSLCRWVSALVLQGTSYPPVPHITDVAVVLDVGANIGASARYFAHVYPDAVVHAFEPAAAPRALLEQNCRSVPSIHVHPFGLFSRDATAELFHGLDDPVTASLAYGHENADTAEVIELRSASAWLREAGIAEVDVLKVDTEGCELPILRDLGPVATGAQVIYVEYHSEDDRLELDRLLAPTHIVVAGTLQRHRGELTYVAKRSWPSREALDQGALRVPEPT